MCPLHPKRRKFRKLETTKETPKFSFFRHVTYGVTLVTALCDVTKYQGNTRKTHRLSPIIPGQR